MITENNDSNQWWPKQLCCPSPGSSTGKETWDIKQHNTWWKQGSIQQNMQQTHSTKDTTTLKLREKDGKTNLMFTKVSRLIDRKLQIEISENYVVSKLEIK